MSFAITKRLQRAVRAFRTEPLVSLDTEVDVARYQIAFLFDYFGYDPKSPDMQSVLARAEEFVNDGELMLAMRQLNPAFYTDQDNGGTIYHRNGDLKIHPWSIVQSMLHDWDKFAVRVEIDETGFRLYDRYGTRMAYLPDVNLETEVPDFKEAWQDVCSCVEAFTGHRLEGCVSLGRVRSITIDRRHSGVWRVPFVTYRTQLV